jgi:hypothetical protein
MMSEEAAPDVASVAADEEGFTLGVLVYGGAHSGAKARSSVWYDGDRALVFKGDSSYVVGGRYVFRVKRDAEGVVRTRRGAGEYRGRIADAERLAKMEADDYAARQELARGQLERRDKRDSVVADAMAPLERLAAGMNYAQRDALIAMVTQRIYRAHR